MSPARTLALGRRRERSLRAVAVGLALLIATTLLWNAGRLETAVASLPASGYGEVAAVLLAVATVHAFYNDGFLVTWFVTALPAFGVTMAGLPGRLGSVLPAGPFAALPADGPWTALALAAAVGFVLGTVGFVVGAGVRRIVRR